MTKHVAYPGCYCTDCVEGAPSARITGDKDRENPVEGAPYGEGLIGRIDTLDSECQRLRTVLQYIADLAYVDQQSGNQNFEYLQEIARAALQGTSHDA